MKLLAALLAGVLLVGCETGQSVGDFLTPDTFELGGSVGLADVDGEFGHRNVPFGWDGPAYGLMATLGWDLTANDVVAMREAVNELRAIRELEQQRASPEPKRCASEHRDPIVIGAELPKARDGAVDIEEAIGGILAIVLVIIGYAQRARIPGVRRIRLPRLRGRRAKASPPAPPEFPAGDS